MNPFAFVSFTICDENHHVGPNFRPGKMFKMELTAAQGLGGLGTLLLLGQDLILT